jgi:hypothetical protein
VDAFSAPILLDFETNGSGLPSSPTTFTVLSPTEYASSGLTITADGGGPAGQVFRGSFPNVGTSNIEGFVIQHGATAGFDTFIDLAFMPRITGLSFDWYSSTVATSVTVSLFDAIDSLLASFVDPTDSTYIVASSPAFVFRAGHFSVDLGGAEIARVRVEDQAIGTHIVGLDNLSYVQARVAVPGPSTISLLVAGILLLIGFRPRSSRRAA